MPHKGQPEFVVVATTRPDGGVMYSEFNTDIWIVDESGEFVKKHVADPTPENIEAFLVKSGFAGWPWRFSSRDEFPADRAYRGAWYDTGTSIDHDMAKARVIHMAKVRRARDKRLEDTDKEVAKLDGGPVPNELKALRQKLRDIPQTLDLEKCVTVEELKQAWPEELDD